ncbi:MAG: alpha-ketoacid dehydrogenase subunit beta [Zhaonellaceae bacterium]|jgi:pyruvate/2-oxoglutarate/acetoin dehydrogenase E1 component|nr:alpha-ketoacid dehydrogenase subunit beta [Clostridia bacterium]
MSRIISYGKAINEALHQEMERDDSVFILGEDVAKMGGDFGITQGIWHRWPHRAKDTALSEQAIIGLANGAAICGLRPVPEIMFADFITCCYDQLVNNAAKLNFMYNGKAHCPITVRTVQGAGIRCAYHHSQNVEAWLMNVPGLVIVMPTTPYEAKGLLISSIRNNNPVVFLEHKLLYNTKGEVPEEPYTIDLYKAEIEREGKDITIVATQTALKLAHEAAAIMEKEGVSVEIIDPRTIMPLDKETIINSVAKTGRLIIAHEGPKFGGFGAEISAIISEHVWEYLRAPIMRVTSLDVPVAFAPVMEDYVLPKTEHVVKACREVMEY